MLQLLLVEDNQHFREVLKEELKEWFPSITVEEASNVKEALEKTDSFCPQVIFMDIRLPDGSGLKLTREIKAKCPRAVVAILTSHDLPEYRQAAIEYGASRYFVKAASRGTEIRSFVESLLPAAK